LRRANRELEEFAYVAGHDCRNRCDGKHLHAVADRDLQQYMTENTHLHARYVQTGVGRMQQLLQDLLAFSRSVLDERRESTHSVDGGLGRRVVQSARDDAEPTRGRAAVITVEPLPNVHRG
jgi:light-regulated signal transduction histidine kinase (bacteriophytochrome)